MTAPDEPWATAQPDRATADQATTDQATEDQATADQATTDQATEDQATADQPAGDRSVEDEPTEYVLPLVLHLEKDAPPSRTDALQAAALAVLRILTEDRVEWAPALAAWQDGRIRKVVRRARGAGWRRAQALPGITVVAGDAQVRVYPPIPLSGWPPELAKLQVSGTELDDDVAPPPPTAGTAVLWLNPAVPMSAGKAMAQVGHAAQLGWWQLPDQVAARWRAAGFPLAVRTAGPERWAALVADDLPVVHDAGYTEVAPGSATALADLRPLS